MRESASRVEREMRDTANRIERAVRRHSSMIVAGTEAIAGLEKTVQAHEDHFVRLERRISELEKRNGSQN
jgi:predicted  nucleic acid-binding Zn-ribbon protein